MPEIVTFYSVHIGATFIREATFIHGTTKITIQLPETLVEEIISLLCEKLSPPPGLLLDSLA